MSSQQQQRVDPFGELCTNFDSNGMFRYRIDSVLAEVDRTLEQFRLLGSNPSGGAREKKGVIVERALDTEVQLQEAQLERLEKLELQKDEQIKALRRELERERSDAAMESRGTAALTPALKDLRALEDRIRQLEERILGSSIMLERYVQQNSELDTVRQGFEDSVASQRKQLGVLEEELRSSLRIQSGQNAKEEQRRRAKFKNDVEDLEEEAKDYDIQIGAQEESKNLAAQQVVGYDAESALRITLHLLKAYIFNVSEDYDEISDLVEQVLSDPHNNNSPAYRQAKLTQCFLDVVTALRAQWKVEPSLAYQLLYKMKVLVVTFDLFEDHVDLAVEDCVKEAGIETEASSMYDAAMEATKVIRGARRKQSMMRRSMTSW